MKKWLESLAKGFLEIVDPNAKDEVVIEQKPAKKPKKEKVVKKKKEKVELPDLSNLKIPEVTPQEIEDEDDSEILETLNEAAARWRETGDLGITLKAPVPLRERLARVVSILKKGMSAQVSKRFSKEAPRVRANIEQRIKETESAGQKANTEQIVREEWKEVVEKMMTQSSGSQRAEIEKIYKQLGGK